MFLLYIFGGVGEGCWGWRIYCKWKKTALELCSNVSIVYKISACNPHLFEGIDKKEILAEIKRGDEIF